MLESDTNFVYIRLVGYDVDRVQRVVNEHGYLIRIFVGNAEKHLRVTIGTEEMMDELTEILLPAIQAAKL